MTRSDPYPLLFLDIDGPLIPFGGTGYPTYPLAGDTGGNPLLDRLDPALGPRLAALPCELVWATTWGADANPLVGRRLGLPELLVTDLPDDSPGPVEDLPGPPDLPGPGPGRLHWKTRCLVARAAGRAFAWVDDEITLKTARGWPRTTPPRRFCTASTR